MPRRLYNNITQLETPRRRRLSSSDTQAAPDPDPEPELADTGLPVYVMLPLDTVWLLERDGLSASVIKREAALDVALRTLHKVHPGYLWSSQLSLSPLGAAHHTS